MTHRAIHYATCPLCEANCGIAVEHEQGRILGVRGDPDDPLSRGHICPKAAALPDIQNDPDRVRQPLERVGASSWREVSWDYALDQVARRLTEVRKVHGRHAIGLYYGNPTVHSHGAILYGLLFRNLLGTRNYYSANSVDGLPRQLVSSLLYGAPLIVPVPDLDRTDFLLILGANPVVSNGSFMTAPDFKTRMQAIGKRGGRVVVVDPRRTETAALAHAHHFIRPGADAFLLAAMLNEILARGLDRPGRLRAFARGLERLPGLVAPFTPERVARMVGMEADTIAALARDFASAPSAVCYGRMGTCTQRFGSLTTWLVDCLNMVTGNLDREGGAMFPTPAVDLVKLGALLDFNGHFHRWQSRVSGLPEFNGELPAVALAEEIATPGPGRVRALLTHAGNPVLSVPNGAGLEKSLPGLDFMVSIDIYRNETTRHAHFILPPTVGLERDHFGLPFLSLAVRNTVKMSRALVPKPPGTLHDWEIFAQLAARLYEFDRSRLIGRALRWALRVGPNPIIALGLRTGPYSISLGDLRDHPHGIDLGPLEPRLPRLLAKKDRLIHVTPELVTADLARLRAELEPNPAGEAAAKSPLLQLISRRQLRSNNSWMHNSLRLVKGKPRCTLLMHPRDAASRELASGDRVRVTSRVGAVEAAVDITGDMMPGVVSLPHGWGHGRGDIGLSVAAAHPGVSINDLTDERSVDAVSGCASLDIAVSVTKVDTPT